MSLPSCNFTQSAYIYNITTATKDLLVMKDLDRIVLTAFNALGVCAIVFVTAYSLSMLL